MAKVKKFFQVSRSIVNSIVKDPAKRERVLAQLDEKEKAYNEKQWKQMKSQAILDMSTNNNYEADTTERKSKNKRGALSTRTSSTILGSAGSGKTILG